METTHLTRRDGWEAIASRIFAPLHVVTSSDAISTKLDCIDLPHSSISRIRGTGGEIVRSDELIGDRDVGAALVSFQLKGTSRVDQNSRVAAVSQSSAALYLTDMPYRLTFDNAPDLLIMRVSAATLGISTSRLLAASATTIRLADAPSMMLLRRTIGSALIGRPLVTSPAECERVCLELLSEAIGGQQRVAVRPRSREVLRAALAARINTDACAPGLTVAELAAAENISVRTVHSLFAEVGTSPAGEIRRARLTRARTLLEVSARPVMDIALACGFSEATSFARAFRREFGEPPGRFRARLRSTETTNPFR